MYCNACILLVITKTCFDVALLVYLCRYVFFNDVCIYDRNFDGKFLVSRRGEVSIPSTNIEQDIQLLLNESASDDTSSEDEEEDEEEGDEF